MKHTLLLAAMLVAALGWLVGCSGDGQAGGTGQLTLLVGDAPLRLTTADVTEVNVSITRVELRAGDAEDATSVTLFDDATNPVTINLLSLANQSLAQLIAQANLGTVTVPAGHYEQLRLYLNDENTIVLAEGGSQPLTIPSGSQSGLKVPLNLDIAEGDAETILLDFNLARFVHVTGQSNFIMNPTALRIAEISRTGNITGTINLATGDTLTESLHATISVTVPDVAEPVTTAVEITPEQTSGTYTINGLPAGAYDVVVTLDYAGQTIAPITIPGVQVTTRQTTPQDINLPSVIVPPVE